MFYCGIDLASKTSALCVMDERERVVLDVLIETDMESISRRLKRFGEMKCLVEAAPLAEWCKRELESRGIGCEIVDTRSAKKLFEAHKKTDQRDARTLARMARAQWYKAVHAKSEEARLLRTRLTMRQGLVSVKVGLQNQIRGLLRAHGIRVSGRLRASGFAQRIAECVKEQPALQSIVAPLLAVWESSAEQLRQEDKALHRAYRGQADVKLLMTVPGAGVLTALAFKATVDDPRRFTNERQVGDYVGLAPAVYQSGESDRRGHITREGDKLLRTLLVEAANSVLYHYRQPWTWKVWAQGLRERKGAGKARVALARRLAGLMWRVWRDGKPFELRVA